MSNKVVPHQKYLLQPAPSLVPAGNLEHLESIFKKAFIFIESAPRHALICLNDILT